MNSSLRTTLFLHSPLHFRFKPLSTLSTRSTHQTSTCSLPSPPDDTLPRFSRETPPPQKSFFPAAAAPTTPNDRVLQQLNDTIATLGVTPLRAPPPRSPVDVSAVNPLSAVAGCVGAGLISAGLWQVLIHAAAYFSLHTFQGDIYVVQRLGGVVRVGVVCLLALASGISGVTGVGLGLLAGRTAWGRLVGEWDEKEQ